MDELKPTMPKTEVPAVPELTEEEKQQRLTDMAVQTFFQADKMLRKTNLSRGAVIRAMRAALNEDLTVISEKLVLLSEQEKVLAIALYEMLTARTLMQAQLIKTKNSNKGENNEQSNQTEVG